MRLPRLTSLLPLAVVTLLTLDVIGCHGPKSSQPVPEPPKTILYVTNGEFLDAVVYVVEQGRRVRLGVASSNRTTTFELPPHLVFAPTPMSFLLDPIGAPARPSTGEVVIDPGDEIELRYSGGRVVLSKRGR